MLYMTIEELLKKMREYGRVVVWTDSRHEPYPGHLFNYEEYPITVDMIADKIEREIMAREQYIDNIVDILNRAKSIVSMYHPTDQFDEACRTILGQRPKY